MFGLLRKKGKTSRPSRAMQPKYIYKPYENSMAYRVEYREGLGYVYPGWGKSFLYKIEGDRIYNGEGELAYIIVESKIYDAAGEKVLCRIVGAEIYVPGRREPVYLIKDSIRVQGTI